MPAIEKLLQRLGYVKLGRYGLALTGEDRVISLRSAVLDDGLGTRIVGWRDADLASAELPTWGAPAPTPSLVSAPPALPRVPPPVPPQVRAPASPRATAPQVAVRPLPGVAPLPVPAPVPPAPVAAAEEPDEDWEWTLAVARARAAAEDVIVRPAAAPAPAVAAPAAKTAPMRTPRARTAPTVPPPIIGTTERMAAAAPPADAWSDSAAAATRVSAPPRATVIPVPSLPRVTAQTQAYRPEPVVRAPQLAEPPRRLARGTRPVGKDAPAAVEVGDRTETAITAAPEDTRTQIEIAPAPAKPAPAKPTLPRAMGVVALPSITRRMAGR